MWFKNLQIYRLPAGWKPSPEALETQLGRNRFNPCGPMDPQTKGSLPPPDEPALAHAKPRLVGGDFTPSDESGDAHRFTQRLAVTVQATLMLQHAGSDSASAFIGSRFDPDWGPVAGVACGSSDPAALLRNAWTG